MTTTMTMMATRTNTVKRKTTTAMGFYCSIPVLLREGKFSKKCRISDRREHVFNNTVEIKMGNVVDLFIYLFILHIT